MGNGGVREKSLLEELETLEVEDHVKKRLLNKYWSEIERFRAEKESLREELYREVRNIKNADVEKDIIISVLSRYIKEKELL